MTLGFFTVSCGKNFQEPIIIWTNRSEIVAYVELFNLTNEDSKAVVVYKENPAESFPPSSDEEIPDIIIGPWLKNNDIREKFLPLEYMFDDQLINKTQFYPQLLQYGSLGSQQYLLPVSFNLSTIVFSQGNSTLIPENNMVSADQIRDTGASVNILDEDVYTSMGFAPSWTPEFLYEIAKLNNAQFEQEKRNPDSFTWEEKSLAQTVEYFTEWTKNANTSTTAETEYQFKYLYNPVLKNVTDNNSLYAFIPSDELFVTPEEKLSSLYYRWVQKDGKTFIHDDMLSMGLYKETTKLADAEQFIIWFMNEENQRTILNWYDSMNLQTNTFGIAGGFSSIRSVNERDFPILYPIMWGNLPSPDSLVAPNKLPSNWEEIKASIILPYLLDATNTEKADSALTIEERLSDWYRFTR